MSEEVERWSVELASRGRVSAALPVEVVDASGGDVLTVREGEIQRARSDLLRLGIYVEPTAAVAYAAIEKLGEARPDSILVPLTGAGLKSSGTRGQPSWQRLSGS